jgi:hypothetical protein
MQYRVLSICFSFFIILSSSVSYCEEPDIEWRSFDPDNFVEFCVKKTKTHPGKIAWNYYNSHLWEESENLKKEQKAKFKDKLKEYMETDVDINDLARLKETYKGLLDSLKNWESLKKSFTKAYLQSLRDIDFSVIVKNQTEFDDYGDLQKARDKMESQINLWIFQQHDQINGWWNNTENTGSLFKDIKVSAKEMRLEGYPNGLINTSVSAGKTGISLLTQIKAVRLFPNLIFEGTGLYQISDKNHNKTNACGSCIMLIPETEQTLNSGIDEKTKKLIENVKNHNKIQLKHLNALDKDYTDRIADINEKIQADKESIKKAAIKFTTILGKHGLRSNVSLNSINYDDKFEHYINKIEEKIQKKVKELNSVFKKSEKIVYILKHISDPLEGDAGNFFSRQINPEIEESFFNDLMKRLEDEQNIGVTVVKDKILRTVKGTDFYNKPSVNSISRFVLIGPVIKWDSDRTKRELTFILGLRGYLTKRTCPQLGPGQLYFPETGYNNASQKCSPCQLPSFESLRKNKKLPDGIYWSRDRKKGMIKTIVTGKNLCDEYYNDSMLSSYFERLDKNTGLLYQPYTGSARFVCEEEN